MRSSKSNPAVNSRPEPSRPQLSAKYKNKTFASSSPPLFSLPTAHAPTLVRCLLVSKARCVLLSGSANVGTFKTEGNYWLKEKNDTLVTQKRCDKKDEKPKYHG